mgnify:FL=1
MTIKEEIEEWKDIHNYEGLYQVSNLGRVKSLKRRSKFKIIYEDIIKKQTNVNHGYLIVSLSKNGKKKNFYVHRLVAEAFIPKTETKNDVNHINENKHDNRAKNLEWCTKKYNNNYGNHTERAAASQSIPIYAIYSDGTDEYFPGINAAARELGLYTGNICKVLKGRYKTTGGLRFEYVE